MLQHIDANGGNENKHFMTYFPESNHAVKTMPTAPTTSPTITGPKHFLETHDDHINHDEKNFPEITAITDEHASPKSKFSPIIKKPQQKKKTTKDKKPNMTPAEIQNSIFEHLKHLSPVQIIEDPHKEIKYALDHAIDHIEQQPQA